MYMAKLALLLIEKLVINQRIDTSNRFFLSMMVHLEPWIHQRIETSIQSIFHVSPRIMAGQATKHHININISPKSYKQI